MKTNMTEKRKFLDFRLKNNRWSKKLIPKESLEIYWLRSTKKLCMALNWIEKLLILVSDITGFVSISVFLALFIDVL